jgi:hypothetical protein
LAAIDSAGVDRPAKETLPALKELARIYSIPVLGEPSKNQPAPLFLRFPVYRTRAERNSQIRHIQNEAILADKYRTGELQVTKTPTKECTWCRFYQMCILHEQNAPGWEEFRDAIYAKGDMYADHRKNADTGDGEL